MGCGASATAKPPGLEAVVPPTRKRYTSDDMTPEKAALLAADPLIKAKPSTDEEMAARRAVDEEWDLKEEAIRVFQLADLDSNG